MSLRKWAVSQDPSSWQTSGINSAWVFVIALRLLQFFVNQVSEYGLSFLRTRHGTDWNVVDRTQLVQGQQHIDLIRSSR